LEICLNKFNDDTFMDYYAIYLEEHGGESVFPSQLREKMARHAINPEHSIVRGIWQTETGAVLGYCEVQNVDELEWEIGIYVLEQYRFQGVGKAAIPLFLDELADMGRHSFVARILPDNLASRGLFEGLGAKLMGTELLTGVISDELLETEVISKKDGAGPEELARLQMLEDMILATKQEVCVYRIEWPPTSERPFLRINSAFASGGYNLAGNNRTLQIILERPAAKGIIAESLSLDCNARRPDDF